MHSELRDSASTGADLKVTLDGQPVQLPAERRSLAAIRCYLETLAMERQRLLFSLRVDGTRMSLSSAVPFPTRFANIAAETIDLAQVPLQLIKTAMTQAAEAQEKVLATVTLVLINEQAPARELWWNLVGLLKQPFMTLSLMPESSYSSSSGGASLMQLRRWQLQQLAAILRDVDEACWSAAPAALSNALEQRVLPWLNGLRSSLELWHETLATRPEYSVMSATNVR